MIVLDASVFNKLFLSEDDRHQAVELLEYCIENNVEIIAPDILPYEAMSTAIRLSVPFGEVFEVLSIQRSAGLRIVVPSFRTMILAERIASSGHPKSGYPDLHDSIYHALALERGGTFLTADRRHFAKASNMVVSSCWTTGAR